MSDSTIATVHLKFFSTKSLYYNFPDFQINCYFIVRAVHNISLTDVMSIRTVYEIFVLLLLVLVEQAYTPVSGQISTRHSAISKQAYLFVKYDRLPKSHWLNNAGSP